MAKDNPNTDITPNRNTNTRNVAATGEEPRFAGPPCTEEGCDCEGWTDETGSGICDCSHPLEAH